MVEKKKFTWDAARKRAEKYKKLGRDYEVADHPDHPAYKKKKSTIKFINKKVLTLVTPSFLLL